MSAEDSTKAFNLILAVIRRLKELLSRNASREVIKDSNIRLTERIPG